MHTSYRWRHSAWGFKRPWCFNGAGYQCMGTIRTDGGCTQRVGMQKDRIRPSSGRRWFRCGILQRFHGGGSRAFGSGCCGRIGSYAQRKNCETAVCSDRHGYRLVSIRFRWRRDLSRCCTVNWCGSPPGRNIRRVIWTGNNRSYTFTRPSASADRSTVRRTFSTHLYSLWGFSTNRRFTLRYGRSGKSVFNHPWHSGGADFSWANSGCVQS